MYVCAVVSGVSCLSFDAILSYFQANSTEHTNAESSQRSDKTSSLVNLVVVDATRESSVANRKFTELTSRLLTSPVMKEVVEVEFENLCRKFAAVTYVSKSAFKTLGISFR